MAAKQRTGSRTSIVTLAVLTSVLGLGGCISYTSIPEPTTETEFASANNFLAIQVTRAALEEVLFRYPMRDAQGRYSVNLPVGTTLESAQSIVEGLPDGVVIPFEGMDASIPMYHIGRIWIRASDAKVDVLYPARAFDGSSFMGTVTIWMRGGGVPSWRVSRVQHWAPGTIPTQPVYVPLPAAALEAREMMTSDGADSSAVDAGPETPGTAPTEPSDGQTEPMPKPEQPPEPQPAAPESKPLPEPESESGSMYRQVPVDD